MSSTLHFPSENGIIAYLEKHPLTSKEVSPFLHEKKVIQAVAKFFAEQNKVPAGVNLGVMLTLYDLKPTLGIPDVALATMQLALTRALVDCANGKKD